MKTVKHILIGLAVVGLIILIIYLFRNTVIGKTLWVVISAVYSAFFILTKKIKQLFTPEQSDDIESIKDRLSQTKTVEKELIDLLMKEREVLKERMDRLEKEGAGLDIAIKEQEKALEQYNDLETWEHQVWDNMSEQDQQTYADEVFGEEIPLEDFEFDYNDM